jgi:Na+/proline symporter
VFHNRVLKERAMQTSSAQTLTSLEENYNVLYEDKRKAVHGLVQAIHENDEAVIKTTSTTVKELQKQERSVRDSVKATIGQAIPNAKTQDVDYIFLNFVLSNLPHGVIGLLLAVMFSAAMSSMAGELNALASTTTMDIYKRSLNSTATQEHYLKASRGFTILWALLAMVFSMLASFAENLIQFVNIVGSLFYGTILGIFLTAFYIKRVQGTAVFWAAIVAELLVLYCFRFTEIAYLLYNIIGCGAVIILSLLLQLLLPKKGLQE